MPLASPLFLVVVPLGCIGFVTLESLPGTLCGATPTIAEALALRDSARQMAGEGGGLWGRILWVRPGTSSPALLGEKGSLLMAMIAT